MPNFLELINGRVQAPNNSTTPYSETSRTGSLNSIEAVNAFALDSYTLRSPNVQEYVIRTLLERLILGNRVPVPQDQNRDSYRFSYPNINRFLGNDINRILSEYNRYRQLLTGTNNLILNNPPNESKTIEDFVRWKLMNQGISLGASLNTSGVVGIPVDTLRPNTKRKGGTYTTNELLTAEQDTTKSLEFNTAETTETNYYSFINLNNPPPATDPRSNEPTRYGNYQDPENYGQLGDGTEQLYNIKSVMSKFSLPSYYSIKDFVLDSTHLWDLKISVFDPKNTSLVPNLPSYKKVIATGTTSNDRFDYSNFIPVLSFSFDEGTPLTQDITLFNEESFGFPKGFAFNNSLSTSILEDENKTFTNYLSLYQSSISDPQTYSVADYKNCCFRIDIVTYRGDRRLTSKFSLIAFPSQYNSTWVGSEEAGVNILDVSWKIVGHITSKKDLKDSEKVKFFNKRVSLVS